MGKYTCAIAPHSFECHDIESEEFSLLEIVGLSFVQQPADVGRGVAGITGAERSLVYMRVVGVFVIRMIGGTLLSGERCTGLSQ